MPIQNQLFVGHGIPYEERLAAETSCTLSYFKHGVSALTGFGCYTFRSITELETGLGDFDDKSNMKSRYN